MIEVKNLSKSYGSKLAVDGISFTAGESEILGFLGPNGAGKSTTMNMLTGYLSSSGGQALINGVDILEDPVRAKKDIGYLPEQPPLYLDMTVMEYLNFVYDLKKCKLPRKSHLAEPTVGLDPKQIIEIRTLIKKLGRNHTVILSSHILSEVQAVCDKIVVINRGKLVANDTTEHLSHNLSADHKLTVQIEGPVKEVKALLEQIPDMQEVHLNRTIDKTIGEYELNAVEGCDIRREVFKRMAARNYPILLMRSSELTLEEIFLKLTTGDFYGNIDNGGAQK